MGSVCSARLDPIFFSKKKTVDEVWAERWLLLGFWVSWRVQFHFLEVPRRLFCTVTPAENVDSKKNGFDNVGFFRRAHL